MQLCRYLLYLIITFGHRLTLIAPINMTHMKFISLLLSSLIILTNCTAQKSKPVTSNQQQATRIIPAAERISVYLPLIKGKRVGIFANQTTMVSNTHLV